MLTIVHTESSLGWGGQEIRVLSEIQGFLARGHRVTLLCPPQARIHAVARERGIDVVALPIARKRLAGLFAMRRWLRDHGPDIVNTHSSTDTWLTALANRLLGRPPVLVRTRHISAPLADNRGTRWLYTRASRHVVTTGERLREQIIAATGLDGQRVTSVPTGIDTDHFTPGDPGDARRALNLDPDRPTVGIVATLRSWKGHRHLLRALAGFESPRPYLLIVGDGPQREALHTLIAELGLGDDVHMPGNQNDVAPWLRALDLFVLPSYANEGVPQAILQAMSTALAVISTCVGSIDEAVIDGETGCMVPPKDPAALATAIRELLADASLRARLGDAGRERALQRFGRDAMLDSMERIFQQALAEHEAD